MTNIVNNIDGENNLVNLERSTNKVVKHFVIQWYEQITIRGIEFQRLFLPKILKHPIWKGVMPNYIEMEHAFNVVGNIAKGRQQIKMSQPHFGISVRMKFTLPKVGSWSPLGLLKT